MMSLLKKAGVALCIGFFFLVHVAFAEEKPSETGPFTDTPINSPHYLAIKHLFENFVLTGFGDGTFRPKERVTRAEALSMIVKSATNLPSEPLEESQQFNLPPDTVLELSFPVETDINLKTPTMETPLVLERTGVMQFILPKGGVIIAGRVFVKQDPIFTDVKKNDWYYPTLKRAVSLGIVKGYADGTFRPTTTVKLVEAVSMLYQAHRVTLPELPESPKLPNDVQKDAWYAPHVVHGVSNFILTPSLKNTISPERELTRGEMATLIYRFLQNQQKGVQFGKASWYRDAASKIKVRGRKEYIDNHLTAAHRTFGFGTIVRVTNVKNGKAVDVVINDRGPFLPGRIIDLSKTAFKALEEPSRGIASVQVEVIGGPP